MNPLKSKWTGEVLLLAMWHPHAQFYKLWHRSSVGSHKCLVDPTESWGGVIGLQNRQQREPSQNVPQIILEGGNPTPPLKKHAKISSLVYFFSSHSCNSWFHKMLLLFCGAYDRLSLFQGSVALFVRESSSVQWRLYTDPKKYDEMNINKSNLSIWKHHHHNTVVLWYVKQILMIPEAK